ncbi:hypothetical protein LINPERPRIM_LOCUS39676 [Linum perenne]
MPPPSALSICRETSSRVGSLPRSGRSSSSLTSICHRIG